MNMQIILGIAIASAFLLPLLAFLWMCRPVVATIEGFSWERRVVFERSAWVKESSYQGFPDGSRNQETEVETYDKPIWGTRSHVESDYRQDSTHSYIVYDSVIEGHIKSKRTKYTYEIHKWIPGKRLVKGRNRTGVSWPSSPLNEEIPERVSHTQELYWVFLRTKTRGTYPLQLAESDWKALDEKATYVLRLTLSGRAKQQVAPRLIQTRGIPR